MTLIYKSRRFTFSLRQLLTIPFVVIILGLALTIIGLSYYTGSKAVDTVSDALLNETSSRIQLAVEKHILGSAAVLEAAFPNGIPTAPMIDDQIDQLRHRFWVATSLHRDPNNYVYYGNRNGQVFGLYRFNEIDAELRMKLDPKQPREFLRFKGIDGELTSYQKEAKLFDPRERPWYKAGSSKEQSNWTPVYLAFSTGELIATRAKRVLGANNVVEGVVATDVSLKALNEFVRNLEVSPSGVALILEPNGDLIASSKSDNVAVHADGTKHRINALNTSNPLVTALYAQARKHLDDQPTVTTKQKATPFQFEGPEGQQINAAVSHLRDASGLAWITIVAVPRSDFSRGVTENVVKTGLLTLVAAAFAAGIGFAILNSVSTDLKRLTKAAERVGNGEIDVAIGIERNDEIGSLAHSFEQMQTRLSKDQLTGLANREAFTLAIERRTERALIQLAKGQGTTDQFAVVFIDLNQFKQINDALGHHMGDEVLIETGRRLVSLTKETDLVARLSGDEFAVLLDHVDGQEQLERFRLSAVATLGQAPDCLAQTVLKTLNMGGSVGYAIFPNDGVYANELVKKADRRMYQRKFERRTNDRTIRERPSQDLEQVTK